MASSSSSPTLVPLGSPISDENTVNGHTWNLPLQYHQLELNQRQIRILRLLPGESQDPIRCTLETAFLADYPSYQALSYAWGDPLDCRSITVDGRRINVTVNLFNALQRLRLPDDERRLWVDALCINQADDVEKSHQVNLMRDIYSRTTQAVLWLGDFAEDSDSTRLAFMAAFTFLEVLAADHHYDIKYEEPGQDLIVQEAVLPPEATLMCGTLELPFSMLAQVRKNGYRHRYNGCCGSFGHFKDLYAQIRGLNYIKRSSKTPALMPLALNLFRSRQASDPRDRVNAFFGLGSSITADYSSSFEDIYRRSTRSLIDECGSLTPLLRIPETKRNPALPTWVPDWCNGGVRSRHSEIIWIRVFRQFSAAGSLQPLMRPMASDKTLSLRGLVLDRVTHVGRTLKNRYRLTEIVSQWQDPRYYSETFDSQEYPRGGTYEQASHRALLGDLEPLADDGKPGRHRFQSDENAEASAQRLLASTEDPANSVVHNRKGIITESGMIGLSNPGVKVGDTVCVLLGGKMPFILRRKESPDEEEEVFYEYVTHAYVHGIMDGQVLDEDRELEWINLV
ncbi:HET domain-containing protein [Fusarium sp. LHS14.1]|nr:HET domain-containing protein [Fusarium sp. LHS14.1]